jgi:hypothetical protein
MITGHSPLHCRDRDVSREQQKTEAARLLTEIVLLTFSLEGEFLAAARDVLKELIARDEATGVPA